MITTIGVCGYTGRMGQLIADIIKSSPTACLAGGVTRSEISQPHCCEDREVIVTNHLEAIVGKCDVIIDFSHASATLHFAQVAVENGKPFMCGTTGLDDATSTFLRQAGSVIPVLYASNTSLSLIVLKKIAALAALLLKDEDFDVSVLERHHKWKKDAPSGTALTLGKTIEASNGGKHPVTYASIRSGAIVGEHEILFGGQGEYITLRHQVTDRRVFAQGAVKAALWLADKPAGYYSIDDVLSV